MLERFRTLCFAHTCSLSRDSHKNHRLFSLQHHQVTLSNGHVRCSGAEWTETLYIHLYTLVFNCPD